MKLSICFTVYNRTDLLFEATKNFVYDERIDEIVIVDDCSEQGYYDQIVSFYKAVPKVSIYRNDNNLDCYKNKRQAIKKAKNDWCLILDSDNQFPVSFIDRIEDLWIGGLKQDVAYQPEWAKPHFNFTPYAGMTITKANVHEFIDDATFSTMLNAFNYLVNREEYLRVWSNETDPVTSDSIFHNYNWLKGGNSIYVVPGFQYEHRVHNGSHYANNRSRTPQGFHDSIVHKLKQMR